MFHPKTLEVMELYSSTKAPIPGYASIMPNPIALVAIMGLLRRWGCGNCNYLSFMTLASFLKAARLPVKVIPPMKTPRNEAMQCKASGLPQAINEAILVVIAAMPTKAWKAATV